ncbi:DUF3307 domain-containing protein [Flammeovirgaceae bacterium SG7u.111]|nr:DUF3307 domain-containing protein [Flammeovirgaceae bacterium SG7u.132]WPO37675.1 DUF3307 domain-containing protein [Flammeovirgaceae bacterium SG7u.111]
MILFFKLLLAHLIGDFTLQSDKSVADKEVKKIKSPYLYAHVLIHLILTVVAVGFQSKYWLGVVVVVVAHYLIDLFKLYVQNEKNQGRYFILDQAMHVGVIALVVHAYKPFPLKNLTAFGSKILLLVICLVTLTYVVSVAMQVFFSKWNNDFQEKGEESLQNAGKYIGMLERLFVFVFVATNHWQAIGFLIAAKSVFRFGDLSRAKDRKLTEYILIGTLLSVGSAILVGLVYLFLSKLPSFK